MKDYRLSEIMSYCYSNGDCKQCELEKICSHGLDYISTCNIEPRDMIELPYIFFDETGDEWVIYRKPNGEIRVTSFNPKKEADEFLQELKK